VITGAGALGFREMLAAQNRADEIFNRTMGYAQGQGIGWGAEVGFYFGAIRLVMVTITIGAAVAAAGVLVALAESIVARRRTFAALTASGVPRRTLAAAVLWQTLTPLIPALLLALAAGNALVRLLFTEVTTTVGCSGEPGAVCVPAPEIRLAVPIPWGDLTTLGGGALLGMLVAVGAGLLVLRSSTDLEELRV
jgi:hypothetical protein